MAASLQPLHFTAPPTSMLPSRLSPPRPPTQTSKNNPPATALSARPTFFSARLRCSGVRMGYAPPCPPVPDTTWPSRSRRSISALHQRQQDQAGVAWCFSRLTLQSSLLELLLGQLARPPLACFAQEELESPKQASRLKIASGK